MKAFLVRLSFILSHRTFKRLVVDPSNPEMVLICHGSTIVKFKRRCPHQGAPLEKGCFEGDDLVCPWHGCHFPLVKKIDP